MSTNWRLDHTKILSRWSELMKYIVYLLTIVLPVKQRTVTRLADVHVLAEQRIGCAKRSNYWSAKLQTSSLQICGPPTALTKIRSITSAGGSCNSGSIRRRSSMCMNPRKRLVEIWIGLEQNIIDTAINERRNCLRGCVREKGQHFEHLL